MNKEQKTRELPSDFLNRMSELLSQECGSYEKAICEEPPISIRINPCKLEHTGYNLPIPWCKNGYYLPKRPSFHLDPIWHAGAYYVQEASSMFLEQIFNSLVLPEEPVVLDACAAPGGKSTHVLSLLDGKGLLVSNEIISKRNQVLIENITKWGMPNQMVIQASVPELRSYPLDYDVVLVDAPCSGEGLFRKDERAIREWSKEHVDTCATRQQHILNDLSEIVRPGGYLIYSTCTYSEVENEDQIQKLLSSGNWDLVNLSIDHFNGIKRGRDGIGFRFYPHRIEGEGFFICGIRRKGQPAASNKATSNPTAHPHPHPKELNSWIDEERCSSLEAIQEKNNYHLFPSAYLSKWKVLNHHGKVRSFGILAGGLLKGDLKPFHSLALSNIVSDDLPSIEINLERAVKYLKKEDIGFDPKYEKGWNLVRYKGITLGWLKVLNNRINNYYPKAWSIRP